MPQPGQPSPRRPAPRLYLITPPVDDAGVFARELAAALEGADIAAVLLRLSDADERTQINRIKSLAGITQGRGAALVVEGHPGLVARGGADGAHLTGYEAFSAAIGGLKPDRIAGCGGLTSRHDAMLAAENGADYVMFGDDAGGRQPSFDAVLERVAWWAEVFQIPCVAMAPSADQIGPLVSAGADFVAVGDFIWSGPQGPATALNAAIEKLRVPEALA